MTTLRPSVTALTPVLRSIRDAIVADAAIPEVGKDQVSGVHAPDSGPFVACRIDVSGWPEVEAGIDFVDTSGHYHFVFRVGDKVVRFGLSPSLDAAGVWTALAHKGWIQTQFAAIRDAVAAVSDGVDAVAPEEPITDGAPEVTAVDSDLVSAEPTP